MVSLISVITTIKNGEAFIIETLDSVRSQSFKKFEHIIVDDGSTDNTISIIKEYQVKYPDYNLKFSETGGLGRGKALNYAVSLSNTGWIAIIDADDIWHSKKLEIQYKIVNARNVGLLATNAKLFTHINEIEFEDEFDKQELIFYKVDDLLRSNKLSHSSVLIKKDLCNYDESRKSQFDYDLWLRLASAKNIVAKVPLILNFHRIHDNQSFEGRMKKVYRWRSFKLKASKCIETKKYSALIYNCVKLIFDFTFPRKFRLMMKKF